MKKLLITLLLLLIPICLHNDLVFGKGKNHPQKNKSHGKNHEVLESPLSDTKSCLLSTEKTQYVIEGELEIYKNRRISIKPFISYNVERNHIGVVGIRVTISLSKDPTEQKLKMLENRIKELELKLNKK